MKNFNKIFGIGLPRTGTTSLHNALKVLGLKSKHFPFELYNSDNLSLVDKFDAFEDSPIPLIYEKLDVEFPNSKFILTTRSLNSWLNSMKWLFEHGSVIWKPSYKVYMYRKEFLGCSNFDRIILERKYHEFHNQVNEYFKNREEDLLIMNIEENANFNVLCEFLNYPAIGFKYPQSNKSFEVPLHRRILYHYFEKNIKIFMYHMYKMIYRNIHHDNIYS